MHDSRPTDHLDRSLRCFLRIAQLGSVSKAADDLGQSQSSLSKQLSSLEQSLGQTLFTRTGRGVSLNDAGELLRQAIEPAYSRIDSAIHAVRQEHGVNSGTVRLATVHTLSYYFMSDVAAAFMSAHPGVNLSLLGRSSPEVVALVESGKADVGFVYDSAVDCGGLISHTLFDDQMCRISGKLEPFPSADLSHQALRLIGFPPHYALRRMIHSSGLHPEFVAEVETIDAMLRLVASGLGDCILPSRIPDNLLHEHNLHKYPIEQPALQRRVVAILRADRDPQALTSRLLECALRTAQSL
ncbi:LysR family transcriptional regulator [Alcaligenes nematophilus]|uniref:LysR family transcriptional regulator n=4 Tax=Alcaligenes TaxID=507 RepID=A0AAE9H9E7_ALCFA|nr:MULTISPECIES: LysR family transcriptional regulator [Alcaligenes]MDH4866149.1 LysR family transcriptional regulator [Bacillus cereus]MBH0312307.1 LysR family transcriptional regulator [Alcaligenes faecalis]MDT8465618.1 LysR family transcriptional regulator [Alcaligenes nematophilus]MDT8470361.1 LysR family transcriptional regulator [Alcaligenes nematophilus]MDT8504335.1 LysR family transcriptional regulator [Alcaligenes nematophilus]